MRIAGPARTVSHNVDEHGKAYAVDEARTKISALYDNGTVFFTKDDIRAISLQLDQRPKAGQTIRVRGLDGNVVKFEVKTGERANFARTAGGSDIETVVYACPCKIARSQYVTLML